MSVTGVIAEFNPFHNGHKYLVDKAHELRFDSTVAVMSGNWVQRGDTAVISKFARTKQALECGFDLVAELPTYWAMATAQKFAAGAVFIHRISGGGFSSGFCGSFRCGQYKRIYGERRGALLAFGAYMLPWRSIVYIGDGGASRGDIR